MKALVLICCTLFASTLQAATLLHPLFSDHVVLQRDQPIAVWGTAQPRDKVTVALASAEAEATADDAGEWRVTLPAMTEGGPHALTASTASGATQRVSDVLVGDVWLCSGQSNMQLQVHRALDARSEIANARNDSVRILTVPLVSDAQPQAQFGGPVAWRTVSTASIADFSAACWFFARELQKTVDVPMGLINAAWGGSKIEAWISAKALRAHGGYDEGLSILAESVPDLWRASSQWGDVWEKWWRTRSKSEPWAVKEQGEWRRAPQGLDAWEEWGDPRLASYDGMVWYRTRVVLTAAQAAQASTLSLGQVDEVDQTWINGRPIGGAMRTYRIPRGTWVAGDNTIVVNVLDTYSGGGLRGPASERALRLADGTTIPLDREWRYQVPPAGIGAPPRAPWESVAGLSVIFNRMIAPLTRFGVRGVAWYQGESNTEESLRYGKLLTAFMADWRAQFGRDDLPFLIVQLANYGQPLTAPAASGWADLREQQRLAVAADPHAALVVAIDLGERYDIHPANKQDVGRRLARAARSVAFGEAISASGPRIRDARREGDRIALTFDDVTGKLLAYGADSPVGFEACGADQASCRYVTATLAGDRVSLDASAVPRASRVRYCWADSPVCTLYDAARLPAGPFEIEVQRD